ncbi:malate synthase G [Colwellia psychrerythraea]|uniref:Malate synthase G n=1 Tax=Colwellia psychrerythraea (strain 34H / ATCC BAA-681) TaxID=167879 RepID=Q486P4_COLP3|nr:malate synthase G [Colwellia psychrerythraea]AAZ28560.1 malate synthase G [Colwellia psychrerythraea 34H]
MVATVTIENLTVSQCLFDFIENEALPDTSISSSHFWQQFSSIIHDLSPENKQLLLKRDALQASINSYHQDNKPLDFSHYKKFLADINYLVPQVDDFSINTSNVDNELALMAGPQLVVPIMNARFALNAVNARWGSLYDALYGTDVISHENGAQPGKTYNPVRGKKVIAFAKGYLDQAIPLLTGNHSQAISYHLTEHQLMVSLADGQQSPLKDPSAFIGFTGSINKPDSLMFTHNGLHLNLLFSDDSAIGKEDAAGLSDVVLESALTTIMDCEDSVAAVDGEDKVIAYRNWLGLMTGKLSAKLNKNGKTITRTMNNDLSVQTLTGDTVTLKGRSLMFVRNVGHLMTNNAIIDSQGNEVPEGILDAMITSLIALHDLKGNSAFSNSSEGSIYIVKPKMHGPEEVAFANTLFSRVETALSLPQNTVKMGIMDEERRTSVNLKNCIFAAKDRVVFINTGFLDRTGDEIHTSMMAGPMARKADIKLTPWIGAYEDNNVDVGLACGFSQKAQIGKGMWPIPDQMANMIATKINHVEAGANTAWVPSPTAATLHSLHYHRVNVFELQKQLAKRQPANIDDILTIPLAEHTNWTEQEISDELDNNCQGILGYVVRWIDDGVGCSKVPDINNVGLMEDRATLRISSQHIANWLTHNICTIEQVQASLEKMANIVDKQNASDSSYQAMSNDFTNSIAFKAAAALIFSGVEQPNGYTEPLLHQYRLEKKRQLS